MSDENAAAPPFEIFRPGTYTAANGHAYTITEDDLRATAEFYDPSAHEAPFVKGHPKTDDPAYGWAGAIEYADGALRVTDRRQVEPAFAEDVRGGRYKKRSASFWPPQHPANPTPGVWALKHIGFLGAVPPAVKGMAEVAGFAEDDEGVFVAVQDVDGAEFADPWLTEDIAGVFRRLREWVIGRFSKDEADDLVPEFLIRSLDERARADDETMAFDFSDPDPEQTDMADPKQTDDKHTQQTQFAEREAALKAREDKLAAAEQAAAEQATKAQRTETASFVEGLVESGQVLPRDQAFLVEFMAGMDNEAVEFSEGDETVTAGQRDRFQQFLKNLPEQVDFSERTAGGDDDEAAVSFAAPEGYSVSRESADLHRNAKAYAARHNVSFADAARAVGA